MIVSRIIDSIAEALSDVDGDSYTREQTIGWILDGVLSLLSKRPDALIDVRSVKLEPGTLQTIPSDAHKLLAVVRNLGDKGKTHGKAIRGPVSQEDLDAFDPDWHRDSQVIEIQEYTYNITDPLHYNVIPPVRPIIDCYVQLRLSLTAPTTLEEENNLPVIDLYVPALIEWCLYRFYLRDSEKTPNYVRAGRHFSNFFTILGEKIDMDMATDPKVVENL